MAARRTLIGRAMIAGCLHAEMIAGVKMIGAELKTRAAGGETRLPSTSQIDGLVATATAEIETIDQPINDAVDQPRRRLGLGPSLRALANHLGD